MFLATGEARFMDVAELALYNSVLSGVSLDGTNFFYTNPLRVTVPLPTDLRWPRERVPFVSSFCCPPNLLRILAESASYAYAKSGDVIWVNLYGGSTLTTTLGDADKLKLTQETEFPWNGRVRLKIEESGNKPFALKFRIPGWAKSASFRINNAPVEGRPLPGICFELRRLWQRGDVVDLDLPMPTRLIEANPLVEETLNQIAVQRGPLVYCLESSDLPLDVKVMDVCLSADIDFVARFDRRLLGGVVVLDGTFQAGPLAMWNGDLYREVKTEPLKPVKASLIPYFAWGNRGKSEMSVWLRRQ
jgi:DUF1680 family protein